MANATILRTAGATTQRICILCGPAMIVVFLIGFIPLAGFVPPPSPSAGAQEIADFYSRDPTSVRLGCVVMMAGLVLLLPWGVAIAALTRRTEPRTPTLTYGQLACIGVSVSIIEICATVWALASFRPAETDPDVTRMLNDLGWFLFLLPWPPFTLWNFLIAAVSLRDHSPDPLFPRWSGYFNIWCGLLLLPTSAIVFFKSGPFGFNGIAAFYVPLSVVFIWIIGMTVVVLKRISADEAANDGASDLGEHV